MPRPKVTRLLLAPATAAILLYLHRFLPPTPHPDPTQVAKAHTVKIVEDVGATLHIEPTDTPRAGEDSLAWFALTRKGGQAIPLSACDCELTVSSPTADSLTPVLSAIDAEGYEEIPSAEFIFPAVGQYTLSLSGSPKEPDDFSPFTFDFEVTVAAGQPVPTIPEDDSAALPEPKTAGDVIPESAAPQQSMKPIVLGLTIAIVLGGAIWFLRNKQKS